MMNYILIGMLATILLAPAALALEYDYECMNNDLVKSANVTIDGELVQINQTIECEFGCDSLYDTCVWPPAQRYAAMLVLVFILFGFIWWFGKKRG